MQTLKTAVVVVLLLAVLYGAYTVINQPPPQLPPEVAHMNTEMWEDEPAVSFDAAPAPQGITAFGPSSDSPVSQAQMTQPPALLPDGANATPPPSQSVDAMQPADSSTNQQATAMLDAPQPLSAVGSADASNEQGATSQATAVAQLPESMLTPENDASTDRLPASNDAGQGSVAEEGAAAQPYGTVQVSGDAPYGGDTPVSNPTSEDTQQASSGATLARTFPTDWTKANSLVQEQQYKEALRVLSAHFGSADLTPEEHEQLIGLLDPLAGKVIYSREHLAEPAHKIRGGETLYAIAAQYQVPWQLLQNINGVTNPEVLVTGTELKVVRGPFQAQVDVKRSELTLFASGMYAGRFPISIGSDFNARGGEYQVQAKSTERAYYGPNGQVVPAGHPDNPYGQAWLDLGGDLAIHGSPQNVPRGTTAAGAISLSPRDARDIYGILSEGSKVSIIR